jgi:hypothetical protein
MFGAKSRVDLLAAIGVEGTGVSFWLGAIIYIFGFVEVLVAVYSDKKNIARLIFLGIGLITLGCYFMFNPMKIEGMFGQVVSWVFTIVGGLLALSGFITILNFNTRETGDKKTTKKEDKDDSDLSETKKELEEEKKKLAEEKKQLEKEKAEATKKKEAEDKKIAAEEKKKEAADKKGK